MTELGFAESKDFLVQYLKGIQTEGLLVPLLRLSEFSPLARSLFDLQSNGIGPEAAFELSDPRLSRRVILLLQLGFRQSILDEVIKEILAVQVGETEHDLVLDGLLEKFSRWETQEICLACWRSEIEKLQKRAACENSNRVFISYQDGYIMQDFVAVKLVRVREAAAWAVYNTLRSISYEVASGKIELPDISVASAPEKSLVLKTGSQELLISFQKE